MVNKRRRNALATRLALIDAVGDTLKKLGYAKLKINTVAQESGMDKTAIYRNFRDFDELLEAYIESQDFWLLKLKEIGKHPIENHREFMKQILKEQFDSINSNEEFQQLLIWELGDKEGFMEAFPLKREIMAQGLFKQIGIVLEDIDVNLNAVYAILIAGINYLILHQDKSTYCNLDITKKDDKDELLKTIFWIVDLIFDKKEAISEVEQIAIKAHKKGIVIDDIAEITGLSKEKIENLVT